MDATRVTQQPTIIIIGAGIVGLASALALSKHLDQNSSQPRPSIRIYEQRTQKTAELPLGGAVHLSPAGLRILQHLDVLTIVQERGFGAEVNRIELHNFHSGARVAELDFAGPRGNGYGEPPLKGLRLLRTHLLEALGEASRRNAPNVEIRYGRRLVRVDETGGRKVKVVFEISEEAENTEMEDECELLLGCDGIHSAVRLKHVEPERTPDYTGVAVAIGFAPRASSHNLYFTDTSLAMSRRGSLIASFFDSVRQSVYVGAILESKDMASREGWRARGADQAAVRADIASRFDDTPLPGLTDLVHAAKDWFLYPVFSLSPAGKWTSTSGRVMLLGDAAHAMPPQGESAGIAMEDAVIFARVLDHFWGDGTNSDTDEGVPSSSLRAACSAYERIRRPVIDTTHADAVRRWEGVKDVGWFAFNLRIAITPLYLWMTHSKRAMDYSHDVARMKLDL